ncbi:MAG: hypothetical protein CBC29_05585 [Methylococcaceae bacterium TMED69]|nr:MAG: hypothetical protein CBC29_05585 [Methylococcaceae bacterium TMED69]|tara:strand:- start:459 stop:773 length:315 start_codon:yes stop_codon:yes gene_type:complete
MATTSATKKATAPKSTSSNSSQKELDALKAKLATLESSLESALSKISALEQAAAQSAAAPSAAGDTSGFASQEEVDSLRENCKVLTRAVFDPPRGGGAIKVPQF